MVEFCKTINTAEVKSCYLNLTDDFGHTYGCEFPDHKTKLIILDGQNKITYAEKHHRTQIWGMLCDWFINNDIQAGSIVVVHYDPEEIHRGYSVVHLITPAIKNENINGLLSK